MRGLTCAVLALALVAGCGGDAVGDRVSDLCTRLDECNLLPAGVSSQECADDRTRCVERLTSGQTEDWDHLMQRCLDLQSCPLFGDCWLDVPWC